MTRDDANALAKRVCNVWRTTIPHAEWANYFVGLDDVAVANRVIDECLERELRSFGEFGAEYRARVAVATVAAHEQPEQAPRLTREQRIAILTRNGARLALVDPAAWAQKGPL